MKVKHREFDGLSGRQIIESLGNRHHEDLFLMIRDLPTRLFIGRESQFHACSTNTETAWIFDGYIKDLEAKKLPYRVVKRIEWFVPKEESDTYKKKDNSGKEVSGGK